MSNETVKIVFGLLGGLAIFIYGMNLMSEGLQKAAGEKMRYILGILTKNPLIGVFAGALTTAVLQSSSATTVMVIGFVSAGLMSLKQAISVVLGANIGTTITAQLIAFDINEFIYPIIVVGFILYFFIKKEFAKNIGQTVFAFGLLFLGINGMSSVMKPLAATDFFANMMLAVQDIPVLGVAVGTVMTVVIQSSSATIAVLQNLASQAGPDGHSILGLAGSMPILFGDNIGTTITAILASIGASTNAKRTAFAHTIFNISGTVIFMIALPLFTKVVLFISPKGDELDIISRQIANAHTLFNVINTLLWLPFTWVLAKIVTKLVADAPDALVDLNKPIYLDSKIINRPVFAIHLATKELSRIAAIAGTMVDYARNALLYDSKEDIQKLMVAEDSVDILQDQSVKYLASISQNSETTEHQSSRISGLVKVAIDIERIGDHCTNLAEFANSKEKLKFPFTDDAKKELEKVFSKVSKMVNDTINALDTGSSELAQSILKQEDYLDLLVEHLKHTHMARINTGKCSSENTVLYTDVLQNMERIGDHCTNIAEAVLSDIHFHDEVDPGDLPSGNESEKQANEKTEA